MSVVLMSPEEFDRRGVYRRRRRGRPSAADWVVGFAGNLIAACVWALVVFAMVWGVMR